MRAKTKNVLWIVFAVAVVVVCGIWFLTDGAEHIEDTNGPDNDALTTITDQDIIDREMGCLGLEKTTNNLTRTVKFHSGKFTGIYEVMWTDVLFSTGQSIEVLDFEVNAGNFKMVVLHEGEIAAVIEPDALATADLGEIKGNVSLVIAGESADFSFRIPEAVYNSYGHID